MIKSIKKLLTNKIDMKDLCVADVILQIKITMIFDGLVLYQSYYIEKILVKVYKSDNSIMKTLINISVHLSKNKGERIHQ